MFPDDLIAPNSTNSANAANSRDVEFHFTTRFPEILEQLGVSVLLTTYDSGKLLVLGVRAGQLQMSSLNYDQPMGLAVHPDRIALGTRREIHFFENAQAALGGRDPEDGYDGCFVGRTSHGTGRILGHDLAWGTSGLWVVNTLFSSLCTLHSQFSFVPRWQPSFVTALANEDRCHLNGLAMLDGQPRFVTALGESNAPEGWRAGKATGGIVIDVDSGAVVCSGLSMPHSPRVYGEHLWVLNSGCGAIGVVEVSTGEFREVGRLLGYTRGLTFAGQFAFVGLSQLRNSSDVSSLPISQSADGLFCGIGVIDLVSGDTVAELRFISGVSEIFAVDVLPSATHPLFSGALADNVEQEIWVVPDPGRVNDFPPERRFCVGLDG